MICKDKPRKLSLLLHASIKWRSHLGANRLQHDVRPRHPESPSCKKGDVDAISMSQQISHLCGVTYPRFVHARYGISPCCFCLKACEWRLTEARFRHPSSFSCLERIHFVLQTSLPGARCMWIVCLQTLQRRKTQNSIISRSRSRCKRNISMRCYPMHDFNPPQSWENGRAARPSAKLGLLPCCRASSRRFVDGLQQSLYRLVESDVNL